MEVRRLADKAEEGVILATVCLSPWAFGAVESWAVWLLDLAVLVLAALKLVGGSGTGRLGRLACVPNVALGGLVLLSLVQTVALPERVFGALEPAEAALRSGLIPADPERVLGDDAPLVRLPPATLSQNPDATRVVSAQLLAAWVLFQVVLGVKDPRTLLRRFGLAVALNGCSLALFALIQWLSWNGKIYWVSPAPKPETPWASAGPFISHNSFAAYLNVALGFALVRLLGGGKAGRFRGAGGQFWPAYVVAVLVVGLVGSHSRGGVLSAAAALAVIPFGVGGRVLRSGSRLVAVFAMVALLLLSTGSLSPFERLASLQGAGSDVRWQVWTDSLAAWRERPVWGAGLGCFATAILPSSTASNYFFFSHGESEYVNMLVEGGLVGLLLALAILAASARLAHLGLRGASSSADRGLVTGALFGGLSLVFHWFSDFSLHVPAVGVTAVVLCALLCRLGLDARPGGEALPPPRRGAVRLAGLVMTAVGVAVSAFGYRVARAEAALYRAGVPAPGALLPTLTLGDAPAPALEKTRAGLERALRLRPDLAEGYFRLGVVCLSQYRAAVSAMIGENASAGQEAMADPLWLHGVVHATSRERLASSGGVLGHEPVRRYLVPAARSFLEARRCCPVWGAVHAELATLDYLMTGGATASYAGRALRLSGAGVQSLALAAQAAALAGDLGLAARCWRKELGVDPRGWAGVADRAKAALPPDRVLAEVVSGGRFAVWFADRLYAAAADRVARDRFFRRALELLPDDPGLTDAERHHLLAVAYQRLGDRGNAVKQMESALELEPFDVNRRRELAGWLLAWGELNKAHRQVLIGLQIAPSDASLGSVRDGVNEALARGGAGSP